MKHVLLACLLLCISQLSCVARNKVAVDLTIHPATHSFFCCYTLDAAVTPNGLVLNIDRQFKIENLVGAHMQTYTSTLFYDGFQKDTLRRLTIQFASNKPRQTITVQYSGIIAERFYADSVADFTAQANWLPNIPNREYELVDYHLVVHVPDTYQVVSTHEPQQNRSDLYTFAGTGPNIEIGAIAARRFTKLVSASAKPQVIIQKANRMLSANDTLLLTDARKIIAFENQLFGSKDPIRSFTFLLPSLNRSASGLLDNAAVIAYLSFNTKDPDDLMILAHEISHKWWGYGTWNDYNNWLNEGFASYSGLLYLKAVGDTASFRKGIAKRRQSAANAPAIINFDVTKYDYPTLRRVLYDKATIVLFELHQRLGDAQFFRILTETAAAKVVTTEDFLRLVEKQSSRATCDWLFVKLKT